MDLSPDGKLILVGGRDYWDDRYPRFIIDAETGKVLREYEICFDVVLKFAPDGKRFMAVTNDDKQRVRIYDISDLQAAVKEPSVEKQE
jgi:WD40 repeat protein